MLKKLSKIIKKLDVQDENISTIFSSYSTREGWELVSNFDPLAWGLGINLYGWYDNPVWIADANTKVGVEVRIGPAHFQLSKYWRAEED